MARIRQNFFSGTLSSQLLVGATTMISADLASFATVTAPDVAYIVIDPDGTSPEIVKITSHNAAATTATIVRGQDSTTDRTWAAGTRIKSNLIASDLTILDEDDFASNSDQQAPTQQSTKAWAQASFMKLGYQVKPIVGSCLPLPPLEVENGTDAVILNRMQLYAIPVPWPCSIDQMGINITASAASSTPRLGLYLPDANGMPYTLLADLGTVSATTTGQKTTSVLGTPAQITTGMVWAAVAWQGGVTSLGVKRFRRAVSDGYIRVSTSMSNTLNGGISSYYQDSVSGALPSTTSGLGEGNGQLPVLGLRVAALL